MDTIIHYFTGTGNTLHAVRMIQDRLKKAGHKVTIQRISYGVRSPEAEFGLHVIAFPTYSWTAPAVVQDYIRRMPDGQGRKAAVFTTYGGNPLGAPEFIHRKLKARGYDVMITGGALYPDNWTQMVNPPDKAKAGQMIKQGEKMTREFAEKLIKGQRSYFKHSFLNWFWTGVIGSLFILFGRRGMGLLFYADSGCNSCGICEKTCPVQNIRMKGNKNPRPVWKFSCEDCCRCINVCPKNAVNTSLLRTGAMCI
ncbi:MAG: EFR1 family ferrodoxin, partial [Spirochaetes bacterium]|nr:EFR1 family ferrodoxin [Spirochaetota bacterium]